MDIYQILVEKRQDIINQWIEAIKQDLQIESSTRLNSQALQDHLPVIFQAVLDGICEKHRDSARTLLTEQGDKHGHVRAQQDFNPEEIVREYFLLKRILLAELQPELLAISPDKILKIISVIDQTIDELMANSFKSYTNERLQQLESLQQQLLLTNQELNRLVAAHRDNLCYLTHEIKNPLTSIIGYSDLFLRLQKNRQANNSSTNLEHIEQVLRQGRKVLRLVNDTIEISGYRNGKIQLHFRLVDVCSLLDSIVISLKPAVAAKGLELTTSCNPEPLKVKTDSLRLQQIITNLISNAIRYTQEGKIMVICEQIEDERLQIIVSDTGIGISERDRQRIFEPYFRVATVESDIPDGIGLGLAIVAQLVNMLNGEIRLNSKLGVGSTFTIILPIV